MSSRRAAFKKLKKGGRLEILVVLILLVLVMIPLTLNLMKLKREKQELQQETELLDEKLAYEQQRSEELKDFETYTKTKKFAEDMAKDKLGYVYEGEIIFQKDE
ncbi:MAG: septum formation initiator family protein [Lachnospiraceae bacterium]|nr:septum formation initiator family protein [Lachnospiraceae bacterium]